MTPNDEPPTVEEIAAAVAPIVDRVRRQPFLDQIALCQQLNQGLLDAQAALAAARRAAVRQLRSSGMTLRELAAETGMTPQRLHQIETGTSPRASQSVARR